MIARFGVWDRGLMTRPISDRPRSWSYTFGFGLSLNILVLFPSLVITLVRCHQILQILGKNEPQGIWKTVLSRFLILLSFVQCIHTVYLDGHTVLSMQPTTHCFMFLLYLIPYTNWQRFLRHTVPVPKSPARLREVQLSHQITLTVIRKNTGWLHFLD